MIQRFTIDRPWLNIMPLTVLAGLLYNSWPLGYWLNPIANRGLASNLEAAHQPYNWVFMTLDIISGLLICIASWLLLRILRKAQSVLLITAAAGFGLFGLLTAIDALLPIDCVSVQGSCGPVLQDPWFLLHGIFSVGSIAGLTISIVSVWLLLAHNDQIARRVRWLLHGTMLTWFGFGIITFTLILMARSSALSQHVFIVVCSAWTALLPYLGWRAIATTNADGLPPSNWFRQVIWRINRYRADGNPGS